MEYYLEGAIIDNDVEIYYYVVINNVTNNQSNKVLRINFLLLEYFNYSYIKLRYKITNISLSFNKPTWVK